MSAQQTIQWQKVRDSLGGQSLRQMPFAQYLVYIGAVEGGVVQFAAPGAQAADRLRRRERLPALPRPVPGFVDRDQEQKRVGQALAQGQLVGVHGADGTGKTALVSQTMRTQLPTSFRDGRVYLSARHETHEDLLQELVESFYESGGGHVKLTENQARRYLDNKQALIAIDDANYLQEDEVKALAEVVPQCAVLITSRKQLVWQRTSVELSGLPRDQAVRLFEQNWGPIPQKDRPAVEAICHVLDDMPDLIIKAATIAAKRNVPLAEMARWLQADQQEGGGDRSGGKDDRQPAFRRRAAGAGWAGGPGNGLDGHRGFASHHRPAPAGCPALPGPPGKDAPGPRRWLSLQPGRQPETLYPALWGRCRNACTGRGLLCTAGRAAPGPIQRPGRGKCGGCPFCGR